MMRWLGLALLMCFGGVVPVAGQTCSLTVNNLPFGTYSGTQLDGSTSGQVTCNPSSAWSISLNGGTGVGGNETTRKMTGSGGVTLNYQIFTDAARTSTWGNTVGSELAGTGTTAVTFYGRIPAGQIVAPGTYTDTLTSGSSKQITVTAVIPANCAISANSLAFGIYNGAKVDTQTTVAVTCSNTTAYQIGADNGQHAQFIGVWAKYMIGPSSNYLRYHLYTDAARSIEWGTTAGTNEIAGTGTGSAQTITVYGTIGAGSYTSMPGSYSDTVTLTITY